MRSILCGASFLMVAVAAMTGCAIEQADMPDSEMGEDIESVDSSAAAIEGEADPGSATTEDPMPGGFTAGTDLLVLPGQAYVPQITQLPPKKDVFVPKKEVCPTKKDVFVPKKDVFVPKKEVCPTKKSPLVTQHWVTTQQPVITQYPVITQRPVIVQYPGITQYPTHPPFYPQR
ncbi:hypothetical protein [Sorangium sp. So ce131]|uniref:hypothetical protein n=1 Tax=Sorangium sp. So ce131 TaxID=3133282 RepID=UPI003F631F0D